MNDVERCIDEWAQRVRECNSTIEQLQATLAAREALVEQLRESLARAIHEHAKQTTVCPWEEQWKKTNAQYDAAAKAVTRVSIERDAAVQEAGRLRAVQSVAKHEARIEAFDEVKALIASHHCPHHWYFEWLIKKMNGRVIDLALNEHHASGSSGGSANYGEVA